MDDCCCRPATEPPGDSGACLGCRSRGYPVNELTIKALLTEGALRRFAPSAYRFCPAPACDVVYFDAAGHTFSTSDLRVPVWQKETPGNRMICYCFDENEAAMKQEIRDTGDTGAIDRVREHIAARRCACDVRNPRGACCLGDVIAAVRRVRSR